MGAAGAFFLFWIVVGGFVGYMIGKSKGRETEGMVLGLLLGVIGWIVAAVMSPGKGVVTEDRRRELARAFDLGVMAEQKAQGHPVPASFDFEMNSFARPDPDLAKAFDMGVQAQRNQSSTAPPPPPSSSAPLSALRPCPWCAEPIQPAAIVCRYCGRDVPPMATAES